MSQIASDSLATPQALYRSEQVRALDRYAIETLGIAGFELMQRAARAAFRELLRRWPGVRRVIVLCGGGNNGGDGYVVAGMAQMHGLRVTCWHASPPERLQGDARRAWTWACERGVMPEALPARWPALDEGDVIVDALLGIGLQGTVRDALRGAIASVNAAGVPILALDVPSGLCADTGRVLGAAVQASATVTFIAMKPGLLTGQGVDYVGTLRCDDLGVGEGVSGVQDPCAYRIDWPSQRILLPRRRRSARKGQFGHVLVVGGDDGMGGAVLLAAEAALRAGAGLVSVATRSSHVPALLARRPEVMARGIEHGNDLDALLARASVIVIGPGLGRSAWGRQLWQRVQALTVPLIVDADALNLLAETLGDTAEAKVQERPWILTPHPGEAARLLDSDVQTIEQDRLAAARELTRRTGAVVVLKGAGSVIAHAGGVAIAAGGNPGMASGGMGDVLAGICGALVAQGVPVAQAAGVAVCWHAAAADRVARQQGYCALLASDVSAVLGELALGWDGSVQETSGD